MAIKKAGTLMAAGFFQAAIKPPLEQLYFRTACRLCTCIPSMPDTRVYIDAWENNSEVTFTFKNIPSYEMNFDPSEITERFTRGDKSRSTDGSGIGLSIAKSLAELQKGGLDIGVAGDLFKLILTFPKAGEK